MSFTFFKLLFLVTEDLDKLCEGDGHISVGGCLFH